MTIMTQLDLFSQQPTQLAYGPFISRKEAKRQGLKYYYVGFVCKNQHIQPHLVAGGCTECAKSYQAKWHREKRKEKPEYYRQMDRNRVKTRTDQVRQREMAYRQRNAESIRAYRRQWQANRMSVDLSFRFRSNLASLINTSIRKQFGAKAHKTTALIGCTVDELRQHLEAQFTDGMTWDNYGRTGWHIDHIRPCASFDLSDPEQQRECFHYSNLQPLWAVDNIRKGSRRDWGQ
jgi:hypothetical protein